MIQRKLQVTCCLLVHVVWHRYNYTHLHTFCSALLALHLQRKYHKISSFLKMANPLTVSDGRAGQVVSCSSFFIRSTLPGLRRPTLPCPTSSANMPSLQRKRLPSAERSLQPSPWHLRSSIFKAQLLYQICIRIFRFSVYWRSILACKRFSRWNARRRNKKRVPETTSRFKRECMHTESRVESRRSHLHQDGTGESNSSKCIK